MGVVLALAGLAGPAAAQGPTRAAPPPGQPTLQTEPGDFWADVKAWNEQARRRVNRGGGREATTDPAAPRPAAPRRPAERRPRPPAASPN